MALPASLSRMNGWYGLFRSEADVGLSNIVMGMVVAAILAARWHFEGLCAGVRRARCNPAPQYRVSATKL